MNDISKRDSNKKKNLKLLSKNKTIQALKQQLKEQKKLSKSLEYDKLRNRKESKDNIKSPPIYKRTKKKYKRKNRKSPRN